MRPTRRDLLKSSFALAGAAAQAQTRPNILLIMADQMVPFLTGAYGHPVVKTPNLDRLARRGIRFDAAYSPNPICAPARACLITGRLSSRIGVHDNAALLRADEPTVAHYLANAGYDTAISGKMHFVGPDQHHGFHKRLSPDIYPADFSWTKPREKKTPGAHARNYVASGIHIGKPDDGPNGHLLRDEQAHAAALQYLSTHGRSRPFFLCVSYNYPHEPFRPSQELWDLYENAPIDIPSYPADLDQRLSVMDRWLNTHHGVDKVNLRDPDSLRKLRRAYYAMVTHADRRLGELVDALENNGLAANTVILFTSDHGDMLGEKGMVQKRSFYEWSARVPLILTFPDARQAGKIVNTPVTLMDIAPTVLDLAGIQDRLPMEGASLLELPERHVFSEMHSEGVYATCFMVRRGNYKYIYIHGHPSQLFDLSKDAGEWTNLAGRPEFQTVEAELKKLILDQFNPDAIEKDLRLDLQRRHLISAAMQKTGRDWKFRPDTK